MLVRVSEIEAFRRWRDDEDTNAFEFLAGLREGTPETEQMKAGTAFHKALEILTAPDGDLEAVGECIEVEGYRFEIAADCIIRTHAMREIRAEKASGAITVTGKADAINGSSVYDYKTTAKFDAESYLAGYQWRLYLWLFGCDRFLWNVFEMSPHPKEPLTYRVHGFHVLEQRRYPEMEADCHRLAADFYGFVLRVSPDLLNREEILECRSAS